MKLVIKIIILMVLLIIGMQNVFGLGVVPASKVINFEPGLEEEFTIMVINSQNKNMNIEISKEGELSEYVDIKKNIVEFSSEEKEKSFKVKVSLPERIEEPGDHFAEIVMTEIPMAEGKRVDTGIIARVAVVSKLIVRVPYVGKYAKAELGLSVVGSDVIHISIPISNIGTEDIVAKAKIKIIGEEVVEIDTDSFEVKSLEKGWINEEWNAISIGLYKVFADVYYGDKVIELERDVKVGEMFIEVKDVLFDKVKLGDVAGFDIVAKSEWNDVIKDAYANVLVKDKQGYTLDELKTASSDINAFSEEKLRAYWDTEGVSEGIYDFIVMVNYEGKIAEKIVEVNVEEDVIDLVKVEEVKPSPFANWIIIGAVLVIIVLVIVLFVLLRRRKDGF